jgi:hypothetical protein
MLLSQGDIEAAAPLAVALAETAVLQPVRLPLLVLELEELQCDPLPLQLPVDLRPSLESGGRGGVVEAWKRSGRRGGGLEKSCVSSAPSER